ncbi:MAG TPA: AbrB/MazE/SpoVT family DNA-binding domain-containing protein [Bryobacteraceae bacterium]|nr:AbrB/MazE/SpoVT family DNA-binding domain-containing protein [Bryobacteraceae bacterium]
MVERHEARATAKGQIVIPAELRKKFGITKGTRIQILEKNGDIVLNPLTPELIRARLRKLRGIVKGGPSLTKELEAERARDLEKEERRIENWPRLR